jgi:hypothetical protein
MLHEIVIQVNKDVATELRRRKAETDSAQQLADLAADLNVELIPQAPESAGESSLFFSIMVPSAEPAQQIADRFKSCQGVNAVYVKPQGGPPG